MDSTEKVKDSISGGLQLYTFKLKVYYMSEFLFIHHCTICKRQNVEIRPSAKANRFSTLSLANNVLGV